MLKEYLLKNSKGKLVYYFLKPSARQWSTQIYQLQTNLLLYYINYIQYSRNIKRYGNCNLRLKTLYFYTVRYNQTYNKIVLVHRIQNQYKQNKAFLPYTLLNFCIFSNFLLLNIFKFTLIYQFTKYNQLKGYFMNSVYLCIYTLFCSLKVLGKIITLFKQK